MKSIYLIIASLFFIMNSHAQMIISDVDIEPKPYRFSQYFKKQEKPGLKTVTIISFDKERNIKNDTLSVSSYDVEGRKVKEIRYDKNKPSQILHYEYTGRYNTGWKEENATNPLLKSVSFNTAFDTNGNILSTRIYSFSGKDTTSRSQIINVYDNNNKLISQSNNMNGRYRLMSYYYENNRLIRIDLFPDNSMKNTFFQTLYKYKNGLLINKEEYHIQENKRTKVNYKHFEYTDTLLVLEKYITSLNNSEITVQYQYDSGMLSGMKITKDTLYKDVSYKYEKGNVKKIAVKTNAWNYLHGEFYIPVFLSSLTPMPVIYEEEFEYNIHGKPIEKRMYLNKELMRRVDYVLEYYNNLK